MTGTVFETTIAAIATPRGSGGVAIVRMSGPESWAIARQLCNFNANWTPGRVAHGWLKDPADGQLVDEVLVLPFQGPRSYTGEDSIEIHCHGGWVLAKTILGLCIKHGAQPAGQGDFTRRAFLNGRIDLTQAESILDLIQAQGEAMVKLAARNLHHRALGVQLERYLENIRHIQATLVASIDFPDEVEEPDRALLIDTLGMLVNELSQQIASNRRNQVLRDGVEIPIVGLPNAGKSSLFNALLASERSIVTDIPGTTRDVIRESLSIKGIPVILVDTAGLREAGDRVEVLGVARSWETIEASPGILYVVDGTRGLGPEDGAVLNKIQSKTGVLVLNKMDSPEFQPVENAMLPNGWSVVAVSASTGEGIASLLQQLADLVTSLPDNAEASYLLSQRQLQALVAVCSELEDARAALADEALPLDMATIPLTNALVELQALLGRDTTELVLDSVFERFCVGK